MTKLIELNVHKDGADPFGLAELQRSQRQELWERQLKLLQHSLTAHRPERWITGDEEDAGDMEEEISEEQVRLLMFRKRRKTKIFLVRCQNDRFFLSEIISSIESEVFDSITQWSAVTHILTIIKQSDAFIVELKEIALSVRRQTQSHYNITAENTDNIQRTIYESTVRMLNDILNPCQQPNS
uniref:Uncharacterized protein n=1 Tax=Cyprinus carpio TaxID=7962 RepID=A0A8C1U9Q0_CYPCA